MNFNILKSASDSLKLNHEGYILIPSLFDKQQIESLSTLFAKWHTPPPDRFYRSVFSKNETYYNQVESTILSAIIPKLKDYFEPFKCFGAMYVVKPSGPFQDLGLHQDWNFVDESKHWSLNMWLPLIDVDENNGAISVIKGSHRFMPTFRGSGTPEVYGHLMPLAESFLEPISMKAGDAIFFFHNLLHSSTRNQSGEARVCIGTTITERSAPLLFYKKEDSTALTEVYNVDESFHRRFFLNDGQIPEGYKLSGKEILNYRRLSETEFLQLAQASRQ